MLAACQNSVCNIKHSQKKIDLSQSTNGGIALRLNLVGAPQEMDAATPNPSTLKNQLLRVADDT
jgi:hypothetical protein